jgi:glutaredoxin-dependent peroxiredoxin
MVRISASAPMEFNDVVMQRRSLRSFAPVEISDSLVRELAGVAALAPSCSNKQPWRFVFVRSPEMLQEMLATLAPGNAQWSGPASLMTVVWSQADMDCRTPDGRDYKPRMTKASNLQ